MRAVRAGGDPEVSDLFQQWYVSEDPIPAVLLDRIVSGVQTKHPGAKITKVIAKSGLECGLMGEDCFSEDPHTHVFVRWTPA